MRARSAASEMRVLVRTWPGRIVHEMLTPLTDARPQWTNRPKPASGNHCAAGSGLLACTDPLELPSSEIATAAGTTIERESERMFKLLQFDTVTTIQLSPTL